MALPSFLCIGAQKAGTTWLHAQLAKHPGVWLPPLKELHFLNHLFVPAERGWTRGQVRRGLKRVISQHLGRDGPPDFDHVRYLAELGGSDIFTEGWYRRIFERSEAAGKISGDITPAYSAIPAEGVGYTRRLLGPVKIVYMLRDPLSRELSQLKMTVSRGNKSGLDAAQWRKELDKTAAMARGSYADHVPRWRAHFPEQDILFLPYGQLTRDPRDLMRQVERFLGLPAHDYPGLEDKVHGGKSVEVPPDVVAQLEQRSRPHAEFLRREFGEDFAEACK